MITKSKKATESSALIPFKAQTKNQALSARQHQSTTPPVTGATGPTPSHGGSKKKSEPKSAIAKPSLLSELEDSPVRSRSLSAHPRDSVGVDVSNTVPGAPSDKQKKAGSAAVEEEEGDEEKLYCICKTKYEEDRTMIGCDRCDDWYHTSCVNMPDHIVDLVDEFICPVCIASKSYLQRVLSRSN